MTPLKKTLFVTFVLTTFALAAHAQSVEFVPAWKALSGEDEKPAQWLDNEKKPIQDVYVKGHWVALDKKNPIAGFSVSEISCDKPGEFSAAGGCREEAASIIRLMGFQLTPEHNEYDIISWRVDGIDRTDLLYQAEC